jgi:hypothetical protein
MTPVVIETGGVAMAEEAADDAPCPCMGTVSGGFRGASGGAAPEGRGTGSGPTPPWMGKMVWHLLHFSFAPPGGMRRSSRLYVAWQDGHVTLIVGPGRLPEPEGEVGAC